MWIVELRFTDEPERLAARPAHRARVSKLHREGVVRMAGPFGDDAGAMIVFDVPDRRTLDEVVADDPYFTTQGVTVRQVRQWHPFVA